MQKRVDIILSYLHKLVPRFRPVGYGRSLETIIQNLETDIMRKQYENSGKVSPTIELKISKSIFEDIPEAEEDTGFDGFIPQQKSRLICDTTPPLTKETSKSKKKKLHTSSKSKESKLPNSKRIMSAVDTEDVVLLESVNPAKKAKLNPVPVNPITTTTTNANDSSKEKGPLRNAFAVLMDRSRQISAQKKMLKLAK